MKIFPFFMILFLSLPLQADPGEKKIYRLVSFFHPASAPSYEEISFVPLSSSRYQEAIIPWNEIPKKFLDLISPSSIPIDQEGMIRFSITFSSLPPFEVLAQFQKRPLEEKASKTHFKTPRGALLLGTLGKGTGAESAGEGVSPSELVSQGEALRSKGGFEMSFSALTEIPFLLKGEMPNEKEMLDDALLSAFRKAEIKRLTLSGEGVLFQASPTSPPSAGKGKIVMRIEPVIWSKNGPDAFHDEIEWAWAEIP